MMVRTNYIKFEEKIRTCNILKNLSNNASLKIFTWKYKFL